MSLVGADVALELRDLVDRYALSVDSADFDAVVALFAPDGSIQSGANSATGKAEVTAFFERVARSYAWTFHAVHSQVLDRVDDDTVHGMVTCTAHHGMNGAVVVAGLRYVDAYIRAGGSWRFGSRELSFGFVVSADSWSDAAHADGAVRWPGAVPRPTQWRAEDLRRTR